MRFIHSLWTKPMIDGVYSHLLKFITPFLYGMSVNYIKKLGHEIVLYTDTAGKELLKHLPYDEIHLIDDELKDVNTKFFAYPKFVAMKHEGNTSVHVDGDLMIKSEKVIEVIKNNTGLATYCEELGTHTVIGNWLSFSYIEQLLPDDQLLFKTDSTSWYNAGLVSIKDKDFFDTYIQKYFEYYDKLKDLILPTDTFKGICPDLVIEQQLLYSLSRKWGIQYTDVYKLSEVGSDMIFNDIMVHYVGHAKYAYLPNIMDEYQTSFPESFQNTVKATGELGLLLAPERYMAFTDKDIMLINQPYYKGLQEAMEILQASDKSKK